MTKEEALNILKNTLFEYSDLCEAVQIAIKSLEKDIKQCAVDIKNYCKDRDKCIGCPLYGDDLCKLANNEFIIPEDWRV